MIDLRTIRDAPSLLSKAKWLEGKTLSDVTKAIMSSDSASRVTTKGDVGYVIEKGYFGIDKNSEAAPDIAPLGVEIKTCPLKYNKTRDRLAVKEPLSLNIINYFEEDKCRDLTDSSLYKKNKRILFILYIHDTALERSKYPIYHVFLWEMDATVLDELRPDYLKIIEMIRQGKAHEIHQHQHCYLTLCPKHNGDFKDPDCKRSKRPQPHSSKPAEIRAFRLKNSYMNLVISRHLGKELGKGGWKID